MAGGVIDWLVVRDFADRKIGALGFIGSKVAVVVSFYDDFDGNMDGEVSWGERVVATISPVSLKNRMVTTVAMSARLDPDVLERDASFGQEAMSMFVSFAGERIVEAMYTVYLSRSVSAVSGAIAKRAVSGTVKQFLIRKGMEKSVRAVYDAATS